MDYTMHDPNEPRGRDDMDLKSQIHCMEKEAYSSVLRAFIAQSDLLSWGKEGLITELRKELNVTDSEHGELLLKINSDESIKKIREWRKGVPFDQESRSGKLNTLGFDPNSVGYDPQKKLKTSHMFISESQKYVSHGHSSATLPTPMPARLRDDQCSSELALFSLVNSGKSMTIVSRNIQAPSDSKGRGLVKSQTKSFKKGSDSITIRATDKLIHEVERVIYGSKNSDPAQVEKAKFILREHESTILEALSKLADVSDGDDSPNQMPHPYSHEELPGNAQGMGARQAGRLHRYVSGGFL